MTTLAPVESPLDVLERIAPIIREHADESERQATLARPIVDALREANLFRQMVPAELGGGEVDPLTWYRLVEEAARIDGSTGWCLFINGSTGLLGRSLPEAEAKALMADPNAIVAGTVFPFGRAAATDGGYVVNGRWSYASGCKHATMLIGFCGVFDGDTPRPGMMGMPEVRIAVTTPDKVKILETWDVNGLAGTGSHDVTWENVFVPEGMTIRLGPPESNRYYQGPSYRLPFMTFFGWPIASVALGIAQHAMDTTLELAQTKVPAGGPGQALAPVPGRSAPAPASGALRERPLFHLQLAEATALVRSARAWLHASIGHLWDLAQQGTPADLPSRVDAWLAASNAVSRSREAVEVMYLAAGGTANYRRSPLQRCLRDIHAASQHAVTAPATWEAHGAVLAGQPPQNPMIFL